MEPEHLLSNYDEREFYTFAFKTEQVSIHFNVTGVVKH